MEQQLVVSKKISDTVGAITDLVSMLNQQQEEDSDFYEDFRERNKQKFSEMNRALRMLAKALGSTEYSVEPYTGDQILEKYKMATTSSWAHKPDTRETTAVSENDIKAGVEKYETRKRELAEQREKDRVLAIQEREKNKMITSGPTDPDSDEDDDLLISRILGGDPNPGKLDLSKAIDRSFDARRSIME